LHPIIKRKGGEIISPELIDQILRDIGLEHIEKDDDATPVAKSSLKPPASNHIADRQG
jgi:predicted metal-dependent phosphoesterase TrpH